MIRYIISYFILIPSPT